ncbi:uncharacterized protein SOCE26_052680 [Sorangium cellulosum]|uniref:Uncharacterized protein n=2 Tax=Sorangium cellulosum TaxID=56 RepID=A0A2L0EWZ1_SORCE|nr:uncharacterized protein SOCE26_052680 [Sorangium cellulosum]
MRLRVVASIDRAPPGAEPFLRAALLAVALGGGIEGAPAEVGLVRLSPCLTATVHELWPLARWYPVAGAPAAVAAVETEIVALLAGRRDGGGELGPNDVPSAARGGAA